MTGFLRTRSGLGAIIALVVGAASLATGMVLAGIEGAAVTFITLGIVSFGSIGLLSLWSSSAQRRHLSSIREATARSRDAAGSIGRMAPTVRDIRRDSQAVHREIQEMRRELADRSETSRGESQDSSRSLRALSPSLVGAIKSERTQSKQAGRLGAHFPRDPEAGAKLSRLLDLPVEGVLPVVGHITSGCLVDAISDVAEVTSILPGYGAARWSADLAYFVLEDRALWDGPWAGAVSTSGLSLFVQLCEVAKRASAQGTVTVFVSTGSPVAALSRSLMRHFAVIVTSRDVDTGSPSTAVLDTVRAYVQGS